MCDRSDDHQDPPAGVEEPDGSDPPLLPEERRLTPLDAIRIGERFRKDLGNIEALAESIEEVGLINPVVLAPDGTLLAGQRRLEAVRLLGWESIDCRVVDPGEATLVARLIEHDENVFRKDFTVEERVRLYLFVLPQEQEEAAWRKKEAAVRAGRQSGRVRSGRVGSSGAAAETAGRDRGANVQDTCPGRSSVTGSATDRRGQARELAAKRVGGMGYKSFERAAKVLRAADSGDADAQADVERLNEETLTPGGAYRLLLARRQAAHQGARSGDESASPPSPAPAKLVPAPKRRRNAESKLRSLAAGLEALLAEGADPYGPLLAYVAERRDAVSEEVHSELVQAIERASARLGTWAERLKRRER